ncbi:uncharacterized protein EI90DRAFT_3018002 [Cantharellus anzutake]|uniref:uncharacterized protein n=1 Tax=Cantharellus anzutake TaxID=1750568 RepID=UPI0019081C21|nr:uncharacterized protein EI90DRAFT_3018002 [Cantharellus anzutake]KAF8327755.1 hypothetical protein EI90DRAFT_3018002 [Cantharellus anzutake]
MSRESLVPLECLLVAVGMGALPFECEPSPMGQSLHMQNDRTNLWWHRNPIADSMALKKFPRRGNAPTLTELRGPGPASPSYVTVRLGGWIEGCLWCMCAEPNGEGGEEEWVALGDPFHLLEDNASRVATLDFIPSLISSE